MKCYCWCAHVSGGLIAGKRRTTQRLQAPKAGGRARGAAARQRKWYTAERRQASGACREAPCERLQLVNTSACVGLRDSNAPLRARRDVGRRRRLWA